MGDPGRPVLVLGGTVEARALADALAQEGIRVVTSLAGRLAHPRLPAGEVRIGGFGGAEALTNWLDEHRIIAVVDATHPFAARISTAAADACLQAGLPLLRVERASWQEQPGDRWHRVNDLAGAAALVPRLGRRVLLTIGRQHIGAFAGLDAAWFLMRCIEAPVPPLPPHHELLLARGPFALADELALLERHAIDLLVTRDSGGAPTEAKLEAARQRGLPVVVVRRPPSPPGIPTVQDVPAALTWARSLLHPGVRDRD